MHATAQSGPQRATESEALAQMGEFTALAVVTEFGQRRCASVPRQQWRLQNGDVAEWRGADDVRWLRERAQEYRGAMGSIHRLLVERFPGRRALYTAEMTNAEPRLSSLIQQLRQEADVIDRRVGGQHGGCWLLTRMAIENRRPIPDFSRWIVD